MDIRQNKLDEKLGLRVELSNDGKTVFVVSDDDTIEITGVKNPREQLRNLGILLLEKYGSPYWDKPLFLLTEEEARALYFETPW